MQLITTTNGQPMTTSLVIAEKFGKNHRDVLRSIRNLECSKDFAQRNFAQCFKNNELANGKPEPYFTITRDGFSFLAMGFTGKKAAGWKEKFITAFNSMERALRQREAHRFTSEWLEARNSGKVIRLTTTDVIQDFVTYAISQGSKNAQRYYMQITKMEYKALFLIDSAVGDGFRDKLDTAQLLNLATAESVAQRAIREGMNKKMFYKDIYQEARMKVEQLALLVGPSIPGRQLNALAA